MDIDEIKKLLWVFGLTNAVKFGGKPNVKAIMGKIMSQKPELRSQIKLIKPLLDEMIIEITKITLEVQKEKLLELDPSALEKKETKKEKKELPELLNTQNYDKIVMRLAPYPSGALHIGNARMIVLNSAYIKRYNGELILFFDDTIGSPKSLRDSPKAKYVLPEAYDLIKDGLKWLGIDYSKIYYKSDRLELYYEYCEKLIQDNMAYVCFCSANEFREKYKKQKKNCPHRDQSIDINLEEWNNMIKSKYHETEVVVRLKTGMAQKDPAIRDQIIMRISEANHPLVGNKYIVWPMLEFSWAIDDHLIGATHILRGADLVKEDIIEAFIWEHFNWKKAEFLDRYFYVEDPITIEIENVPFSKHTAEPLVLPSNPKKGKRKINVKAKEGKLKVFVAKSDAYKFKIDQNVRLKDLINIKLTYIDVENRKINAQFHSYELNREYSIIQWVCEEENVKVSILKPDGTISKGNGELNLVNIPMNKTIQFERFGFVNPIKWEKDTLECYFTH